MARSQRKDGPQPPEEPADEPPQYTPPGPTERVYAVVFGRVWLAALGAVAAMGRWTVTASDPVRGEILVEARGVMSKNTRPARVRIVLDGLGLTRVDATFLTESGAPAEGVEPRQIARFHRKLETLLRRDSLA
jgi:hypothetical protein